MEPRTLEVIEQLERFMRTVDDALPLPREAAEFVHALLIAIDARHAVEIGTSYGYSGLWIAAALAPQNGRLLTIDRLDRKTDAARANFEAAGLLSAVEFVTGRADEVLASIEGPIDFVLNDADKENCIRYVELISVKLSDRAVVLTDNTTTHRDELAEFINWIRSRPDFVSVEVPVGNGMEMSVKCSH